MHPRLEELAENPFVQRVNILAIETSSEACSCALKLADGSLRQRFEVAPRRHTQLLLPMVDALLDEADLPLSAIDCFAFGCGPGSFTGVRIAASAIQGLALAADRPVLAVSSLAAVAAGHDNAGKSVLAIFDARMGEVYLGAFHVNAEGLAKPAQAEQLGAPETVKLPDEGAWHAAGAGWPVHGECIAARLGQGLVAVEPERLPTAEQIARLAEAPARAGEGVVAEQALPNYMRRHVATPRRQ